jgi:butyryl-CoA dehydrogenase
MVMQELNFELIEAVDRFARERLAPNIVDWDEAGGAPQEVLTEMAELGLFGLLAKTDVGGMDLDFPTFIRIIERLAYHGGGLSTLLHVHNFTMETMVMMAPEANQDVLSDMASGQRIGAFCLSEPHAGSDTSAIKTRAVRDGDEWVLNGTKCWVSNGRVAGLAMVVTVTDPDAGKKGFSMFAVPTETPGWNLIGLEKKLGQKVSDTATISLEDLRVPASALIGEEGAAYGIILGGLSNGRISIASQSIGFAQAAFDLARDYAQERVAFDKKIIDHQALAFRLADMATNLDVARAHIGKVAEMVKNGEPSAVEASMTKLFATQIAEKVCTDAIQIFGGAGFVEETGVARHYRDQRICQIYEGTNDMQRIVISRSLGSRGM